MLVDNVVLMTTHRCNMSCDHCIRGWAENEDMPVETALDVIRTLRPDRVTLSGGEPTLRMDIIEALHNQYIMNDYATYGIFMATNGKLDVKRATRIVQLWQSFAQMSNRFDNSAALRISRDEFHKHSDWAYNYIRGEFNKYESSDNLYLDEWGYLGDDRRIIKSGKAAEFSLGSREIGTPIVQLDRWGCLYGDAVTVDCNGMVSFGCDWSYDKLRENAVCHYTDLEAYANEHLRDYEELEPAESGEYDGIKI